MKRLIRSSRVAFVVFVSCLATLTPAPAQTLTTLVNFNFTNGDDPAAGLVQGTDGNLYGTTYSGGAYVFGGTVFRISPEGTLTTLYSFCPSLICNGGDATSPVGALVQGTDGDFFGTAFAGGAGTYCGTNYGSGNGRGAIFKVTSSGKLTTLYNFCSQPNCTDGANPEGGLILGSDGNFYGTTSDGGANSPSACDGLYYYGCGTVFKITPKGVLTTLYSFCGQANCADGYSPYAALVQSTDGSFYGTTYDGGTGNECQSGTFFGCGTVFKISPAGNLTTLYSFCIQANCPDGNNPSAGLVQGTDGNFYGTTLLGGSYQQGEPVGFGTVFKITPGGTLTTLHRFVESDGDSPSASLVQAKDGNFYGTTLEGGGGSGRGTIFEITPGAAFTTLYIFCADGDPNCPVGTEPGAPLMQATNGILYGTNTQIGSGGGGTVFSLDVGLGPFVQTQTSSGKVGATITILGNNLTGATGVSFDGTPATITVDKASEIKTKVPAGATTGIVKVTTPNGTLTSNVPFRVTPQLKTFTPKKGPAGTQVLIGGISLSQTTQITFDGVAANAFTVDSDSQVTVTVPVGATTGKIAITTAGGTATSAAAFKVTE